MRREYENLIALLDEVLILIRKEWINARLDRKSQWEQKINNALDKRLHLMEQRDFCNEK